jgi:hypothetical protein
LFIANVEREYMLTYRAMLILAFSIMVSMPVAGISGSQTEDDLAPYSKEGNSIINGVGFSWTVGAGPQYADFIYVFPFVPSTQKWLGEKLQSELSASQGKEGTIPTQEIIPADPLYKPYIKFFRTDPHGEFWAYHLPAGKYLCSGKVAFRSGPPAFVWAFVDLRDNEQQRVVVTK